MWFRLPIDGFQLDFQIEHYHQSKDQGWEDQWCEIGFCVDNQSGIRYAFYEDETLLSCEVEEIEENLTLLLEGKLDAEKTLEFIEPDFQMTLFPQTDVAGIAMEWRVYFWNEGITESHLALSMIRSEIEYLRDYLRLVIGKIKPSQEQIWHILDPVNTEKVDENGR
jgi:hypothetical protein